MTEPLFYQTLTVNLENRQRICLQDKEKNFPPTTKYKEKNIYSLNDIWSLIPGKFKSAAVLVPLYYNDGQYYLTLIKRTQKSEYHKGEISFPGGSRDKEDNSLINTALRETQEEIGVENSLVKILGVLDDVFTVVSGFVVTPYVGVIPYPYHFHINETEVQEILQIPLDFFLYEQDYREGSFIYQDKQIKSYFYNWSKEHVIWGVTAYMIKNLCTILKRDIL